MLNRRKQIASVTGAALCGLVSLVGCGADAEVVDAPAAVLALSWSIEGETAADLCEEYNAETLQAIVTDEAFALREFDVPCQDFSAEFLLLPGDFATRATLLDPENSPVSERLGPELFTLGTNDTESVEFDFTESSFLE